MLVVVDPVVAVVDVGSVVDVVVLGVVVVVGAVLDVVELVVESVLDVVGAVVVLAVESDVLVVEVVVVASVADAGPASTVSSEARSSSTPTTPKLRRRASVSI